MRITREMQERAWEAFQAAKPVDTFPAGLEYSWRYAVMLAVDAALEADEMPRPRPTPSTRA